MRTDDVAHLAVKRGSEGEHEDCLITNLNQGRKRYRTTAENSNELVGRQQPIDNLMGKIRVTHVDCSELSQPAGKPASDSVIP